MSFAITISQQKPLQLRFGGLVGEKQQKMSPRVPPAPSLRKDFPLTTKDAQPQKRPGGYWAKSKWGTEKKGVKEHVPLPPAHMASVPTGLLWRRTAGRGGSYGDVLARKRLSRTPRPEDYDFVSAKNNGLAETG